MSQAYSAMLTGRRALIAGNAPEICSETARLFKQHGARVAELRLDGQLETNIQTAMAECGSFDILVVVPGFEIVDLNLTDENGCLYNAIETDILASVSCIQAVLPKMLNGGRGEIVALTPEPGSLPVDRKAAAAALSGTFGALCRNLTMDYAMYQVRANRVLTPFDPSVAKEAANAALWAACDLSRFVLGETIALGTSER